MLITGLAAWQQAVFFLGLCTQQNSRRICTCRCRGRIGRTTAQQWLLGKNFRDVLLVAWHHCEMRPRAMLPDVVARDRVAGRSAIQVDRLAYRWALAFGVTGEGNGPRAPCGFVHMASVGIVSLISLNQSFTLYCLAVLISQWKSGLLLTATIPNLGVLLCFIFQYGDVCVTTSRAYALCVPYLRLCSC